MNKTAFSNAPCMMLQGVRFVPESKDVRSALGGLYEVFYIDTDTKKEVRFTVPAFSFLPPAFREPHALFFYVLQASQTQAMINQANAPVYEGEPDPAFDFRNLFTSCAILYGVDPNLMLNAWHDIKIICEELNIELTPDVVNTSYDYTKVKIISSSNKQLH